MRGLPTARRRWAGAAIIAFLAVCAQARGQTPPANPRCQAPVITRYFRAGFIPDVRKCLLSEVDPILRKLDLPAQPQFQADNAPAGMIVDQQPPPKSDRRGVSQLMVTVSEGPAQKPTTTGEVPTPPPSEAPASSDIPVAAPSDTPPSASLPPTEASDAPASAASDAGPASDAAPFDTGGDDGGGGRSAPGWLAPLLAIPLIVGIAAVGTASVRSAQRRRWLRLITATPTLDLDAPSSVGPILMEAPALGLHAWLEPGEAAPVGPIPIKAEAQDA